jgi:hypothetical protein
MPSRMSAIGARPENIYSFCALLVLTHLCHSTINFCCDAQRSIPTTIAKIMCSAMFVTELEPDFAVEIADRIAGFWPLSPESGHAITTPAQAWAASDKSYLASQSVYAPI